MRWVRRILPKESIHWNGCQLGLDAASLIATNSPFRFNNLRPGEVVLYRVLWGAKTLAVENTGPPRGETVNPFLFRFESFLGSGRCCALRAITNLDERGRVTRARRSPGCITGD